MSKTLKNRRIGVLPAVGHRFGFGPARRETADPPGLVGAGGGLSLGALIIRWLINAGAILLVAHVLEGIEVDGLGTALVAAVVLGLVNALIRPVVRLLTIPLGCLTLGLFTFVINALMLWLTASLVRGFDIHGFLPALLGSVLISAVSAGASWLLGTRS